MVVVAEVLVKDCWNHLSDSIIEISQEFSGSPAPSFPPPDHGVIMISDISINSKGNFNNV